MQLRILKSAFEDLDRGRAFYARHADELGDYFLDSLFADIDSLALYAGIHMQVWGYHRMLAKRFPFAIYYKIEGDVCTVWRVLDCRRQPSRLRRDLSRGR
jgi:ParE toxin of type II toxin-antitoxin system, parDE